MWLGVSQFFGLVLECGASKPQPVNAKGYGLKSLLPPTRLVWFCVQVFKEGPQNTFPESAEKPHFHLKPL